MRIFKKINGGLDRPGCGFLDANELGRFLDGALEATRLQAFAGHQLEGCSDCALLAADAAAFRGVVEGGILPGEQRDFDSTKAILKAELRQKLETLDAGRASAGSRWFQWAPALGAAAALLLLAVTIVPQIGPGPGTSGEGEITLADGKTVLLQPFGYGDRIVTRAGDASTELWRVAGEAYRDGRFADAVAPLQTLVERHADNIDAHLYLGNALLMTGEFDRARTTLERAETLAGRGSAASFGLAQALLGLGDREGAVAALEAVIDRDGLMAAPAAKLLAEIGSN